MAGGPRFTIRFTCPNCGQAGTRTWEESASKSRIAGEGRVLLNVSDDFHIEAGRTRSGEPLIVCNVCDEIQPD
jgi:hypothetical protein